MTQINSLTVGNNSQLRPEPMPEPKGAINLGVDIGSVVNASFADEYEPPPEPRNNLAPASHPAAPPDDVNRAAQTFAELAAGNREETPLPPIGGETVDLQKELDPLWSSLEKTATLEAKLGSDRLDAFKKLRDGMMLVTSDGQAVREPKAPVDEQALARLQSRFAAQKASLREDLEGLVKNQAKLVASTQENVAALVERVLRESYMLSNLQLMDYAEKCQLNHKVAKNIRTQLAKAREVQTTWAAAQKQLGQDQTYVAQQPFPWTLIDNDGGTSVPAMTEEDVDALSQAQADQTTSSKNGLGSANEYQRCLGPSTLTPAQMDLLDAMKNRDDADYIRGHLDELLATIPAMTFADMASRLQPIMMILGRGGFLCNYDQELAQICRGMSNVQLLHAHTTPGLIIDSQLTDDQRCDLNLRLRAAMRAVQKDAVIPETPAAGDINAAQVNEVLAALGNTDNPATTADQTPALPTAGSPKQASTPEQLSNYIKELEDQLSSNGDDGQLVNLDLQNALNKQQQTLQMLSNIAKVLHDTAMSIIRKSGD